LSKRYRQLEKEFAGSPSARARQPFLGAKLNFLSLFYEVKEPKSWLFFILIFDRIKLKVK